jgi:hypothetical protein
MSTFNEISGGAFQDSSGNLLANGYLIMKLSQDGVVNTNTMVCAGYEITVPLDVNGNVLPFSDIVVWPNDVITPSGTFYTIYAYSANGQLVWGPNYAQILSTPSPFNLGSITP